ncbi:sigma-E factor negative regulatory protein [Duganella sp. LX20W]|uniref:Sigma-E factor negative regulatory protein n=1 Tax=Rugamonas brunnea TaxID=2758569 RepID=A0A7W2ENM3_9BURK|nr:sigma-E factor negative regulatory protein [Rugamonas brunnea]MBA5635629.1 sigma-E factor negative regulatory protein [Rugamonas brunnea]
MDTSKRLRENISALADGELPDSERELALAALGGEDGRAAWRAYQAIGDTLRDGAAGTLSDGFAARLARRLAAEPPPAGAAPAPSATDAASGPAASGGEGASPAVAMSPS